MPPDRPSKGSKKTGGNANQLNGNAAPQLDVAYSVPMYVPGLDPSIQDDSVAGGSHEDSYSAVAGAGGENQFMLTSHIGGVHDGQPDFSMFSIPILGPNDDMQPDSNSLLGTEHVGGSEANVFSQTNHAEGSTTPGDGSDQADLTGKKKRATKGTGSRLLAQQAKIAAMQPETTPEGQKIQYMRLSKNIMKESKEMDVRASGMIFTVLAHPTAKKKGSAAPEHYVSTTLLAQCTPSEREAINNCVATITQIFTSHQNLNPLAATANANAAAAAVAERKLREAEVRREEAERRVAMIEQERLAEKRRFSELVRDGHIVLTEEQLRGVMGMQNQFS